MGERTVPITKEMILAIDDPDILQAWLDEEDAIIKRIEVDLEFRSDADLEWERKARSALVAHQIILGQISRRLRALTPRRERPEQGAPGAAADAKARKMAAHAERLAQENAARRAKAEVERMNNLKAALTFARRTSYLAAFHAAAQAELDDATLGRIANAAHAAVRQELEAIYAPPEEQSHG